MTGKGGGVSKWRVVGQWRSGANIARVIADGRVQSVGLLYMTFAFRLPICILHATCLLVLFKTGLVRNRYSPFFLPLIVSSHRFRPLDVLPLDDVPLHTTHFHEY